MMQNEEKERVGGSQKCCFLDIWGRWFKSGSGAFGPTNGNSHSIACATIESTAPAS